MTDKELVAELNHRCEKHMTDIGESLEKITSAVWGNGKD